MKKHMSLLSVMLMIISSGSLQAAWVAAPITPTATTYRTGSWLSSIIKTIEGSMQTVQSKINKITEQLKTARGSEKKALKKELKRLQTAQATTK